MAAIDNSSNGILLQSDTNELEVVEFQVDEIAPDGSRISCFYGTNVAKVREIIRIPKIWKGLDGNPSVAGMIKLRDKVITVLDLATILGKRTDDIVPDKIVVLEFNNLMVGVLVHAVSRIHRLSWTSIETHPSSMAADRVTGVVKMNDRILLLLDFERITGELCPDAAMQVVTPEILESVSWEKRAQHTVLVADDSAFIRNTMIGTLKQAGYNVLSAENGQLAWDKVGSGSLDITMMITDIEMPVMDGLHLTAKVRRESKTPNIPIVIFSSLASEDNKRKWLDLGANDILTKPDLPKLVQVADRLCGLV